MQLFMLHMILLKSLEVGCSKWELCDESNVVVSSDAAGWPGCRACACSAPLGRVGKYLRESFGSTQKTSYATSWENARKAGENLKAFRDIFLLLFCTKEPFIEFNQPVGGPLLDFSC
jgi:hypothetical protein